MYVQIINAYLDKFGKKIINRLAASLCKLAVLADLWLCGDGCGVGDVGRVLSGICACGHCTEAVVEYLLGRPIVLAALLAGGA